MIKQNLHTHSTYCDGKDTLEEIIQEAINRGFTSLGFSSHQYSGFPFDECGIKSRELAIKYLDEVDLLKEKYKNKIEIYTGLELESTARCEFIDRLDYSLGSVHWFYLEGKAFSVDSSAEEFLAAERSFGSLRSLIESYFNEVMRFITSSSFDILAHIDLVTKFNQRMNWEFESSPWYKEIALETARLAVKHDKLIEVNTGAISRGYRTTPYPNRFILEYLKDINAKLIISSDCHNKDYLDYKTQDAKDMVKAVGFKELYYLTQNGFKAEHI